MLPFLAAGGASPESATLLPALGFALVPALLVWAGREADGDRGVLAGLGAGALWLVSPAARMLATVALRETTGAALGVAALAAYLRARRRGTPGAWRLAGGLLLALFWVKYNYFLLTATALVAHVLLEAGAEARRAWLSDVTDGVLRRGWRSPMRWAALALAPSGIALLVGVNPGNFLYAALVAATISGLFHLWKARSSPREALDRLEPAARGLLVSLILPVWIWSLSPRPVHPRSLFAFLRNREGHAPLFTLESIAFYPRAFLRELVPSAGWSWAIAILAGVGLVLLLRRPGPGRAVALTAAIGIAALVAHPLKETRFLITVAPAVFLVAALVAARAAAAVPLRPEGLRLGAALVLGLASLGGAVWGAGSFAAGERLVRDHAASTAEPAFHAPLADVARRLGAGERVAMVGGVNELSESAARWWAWRETRRGAPHVRPLRGLDGDDPPERVRARFASWLERERPDRIVSLRPLARGKVAASGDYRRWNAWQREALAALASDPAWHPARPERYPAAGLEITTWVRRGG